MARVTPLSHRPQSIGEVGLRAGTNTANQMKAETLKGFNEAFQEVTDPIVAGALAGEAEADRLAKFELEKNLPIEQIPENEGGFNPLSLTKWGRAYDASYNEIDKQLISYKAEQALKENALMLGRPENQGPGVTAAYAEQSKQIIEAYVANAAPANRTELMLSLGKKAATNEFALAETEANYNRVQLKSQIEETVIALDKQLENAELMADEPEILRISSEIERNIDSQTNLNLLTHAEAKSMKEDLASRGRESYVVGLGIKAEAEGRGAEFVADIISNADKYNLTVGEAYSATKKLLGIRDFQQKAKADAQATAYAQLNFAIDNNMISDPKQIINTKYLSEPQKLSAMSRLSDLDKNSRNQQYQQSEAIANIIQGQSGAVSNKTVNSMYKRAQEETRAMTGQNPTFLQNASIIIGDELPDTPVYPATGIRGLGLQRNVAEFDKTVSLALTSGDSAAAAQAAIAYDWMVNTKRQPNSISLEGDALAMAIDASALINIGTDPIKAIEIAQNNIIFVNDTVRAQRINAFKKSDITNKLPGAYQETFGVAHNEYDGSYSHFTNIMGSYYAKSGNLESARNATAQVMRHVKPSKYFAPGTVQPFAPEDLPVYQVGNAFDNMFAFSIQHVIDENALQRKSEGTRPYSNKIEWVDTNFRIDLKDKSPENLVLTPFLPNTPTQYIEGNTPIPKPAIPRIKITPIHGESYISPVFLQTTTETPLGANGQPVYQMMYLDEFGGPQILSAAKNGATGFASFQPEPLKDWAPEIFEERYNEQFTKAYNEYINEPAKNLISKELTFWKSFMPKSFTRDIIFEARELLKHQEIQYGSNESIYKELENRFKGEEE